MVNLIYALKNNILVSIEDVETGKTCDCICPSCKKNLIAKKGTIRMHHFAHESNFNCKYGYETSLHWLAKRLFEDLKEFTLPEYTINYGFYDKLIVKEPIKLKINNVYIETYYQNIKPDIILEFLNNKNELKKLAVEIFVTHKIDDKKINKLKELKLSTIEIDLSEINADPDKNNIEFIEKEISKIITSANDTRKYWIYNIKESESLNEKNILNVYKGIVECPKFNYIKNKNIESCKDCEYFLFYSKYKCYVGCSHQKINDLESSIKTHDIKNIEEYKIEIDFLAGDKSVAYVSCPLLKYKKFKFDEKIYDFYKDIYRSYREHNQTYCNECRACSYFLNIDLKNGYLYCKMKNAYKIYEFICPKCKSKLIKRTGKNGDFIGCTNFPNCKYTRNYDF